MCLGVGEIDLTIRW